jgi:hypothetical protein
MNFYQAPIARTFVLTAKDAASTEAPLAAVGGVWPTAGKANGRAVTVFFETPGWPTASHKIAVRVQGNGAGNNGSFAAAPNVCLSDADEYLFLRGNSVYANNGTVANGTHVVYSATLEGIQPSATRAASSNNYWVRPGDTFTFTNPVQAATVGSNLGNDGAGRNQIATVTSVRQKGGPDRLVIEFSVPIVTTAVLGYRAGVTANTWPLRDLVFFQGATVGAAVNPVGLAFNRLTVQVSSSSNWSGALSGAVNLTYPSANPAGLYVPDPAASAPAAAGLINPSNMTIMSAATLTTAGTALTYDLMGNLPSVDRYSNAATFEHRPDFNQGSAPYRSISFSASAGTWVVEVLVHPLH